MTNTTTAIVEVAKELEKKEVTTAKGNKTSKVFNMPKRTYTYKGKINETDFPEFVNLCKLSQKKLKQYLCGKMKKIYDKDCYIGDGYIYCKGNIPVLLTAHMDTVHKELIKTFYEDVKTDTKGKVTHTISSPEGIGGDDRCGIYMILEILKAGYLPYILFCEDEEIGGVGSDKFCYTDYVDELKDLKFLIELDRANSNDLVFYNDGNKDWKKWLIKETGWKEAYGSFSDICNLSPECFVSSVNLSCGYYNAHTLGEYVVVEEMLNTIEVVKHLLDASESIEQFVYIEEKRYYGYSAYSKSNYYGSYTWSKYDDWYDEDNYYNYNNYKKAPVAKKYKMEVLFLNEHNREEYGMVEGEDKAECWMNFFMEYYSISFSNVLDWWLIPIV